MWVRQIGFKNDLNRGRKSEMVAFFILTSVFHFVFIFSIFICLCWLWKRCILWRWRSLRWRYSINRYQVTNAERNPSNSIHVYTQTILSLNLFAIFTHTHTHTPSKCVHAVSKSSNILFKWLSTHTRKTFIFPLYMLLKFIQWKRQRQSVCKWKVVV